MTASLQRRLGLSEAVVVGLGSMLGAGVFVVFAPAAAEAGTGWALLAALAVAGFVAYCNAISSTRLAVRYPESGGTYVYGRARLGALPGFLAGWGFVVGKTASCAAMALTLGTYLWPGGARLVAVAAVAVLAGVNLLGVAKTARATRALVAVTLAVLATVAVVGLGLGGPEWARLAEGTTGGSGAVGGGAGGATGVLTAAGLLFFAFAGYARVATLGEEVRDPRRTIPRAIPLALGLVLGIYLVLAVVSVVVLGPERLAAAAAPLAEVVRAADLPAVVWVVRVGAAVAVTGVLLALLAGVARTVLAMARRRDLPSALDAVHARRGVPHRAELLVALAVAVLVSLGDLRDAIGFSSFTVLVYYAVTNASAFTLRREQRAREQQRAREPRQAREPGAVRAGPQVLAVAGLVGCLTLAATLPPASVLTGAAVLGAGLLWYGLRALRRAFRG